MSRSTLVKSFILVLFFCFGLFISFVFQKKKAKAEKMSVSETTELASDAEEEKETESKTAIWQEEELNISGSGGAGGSVSSTSKFTIKESVRISADKTSVQTGEDVRFWLTIKNDGSKVKTLTHMCFNHSGGVTFGCLLDHTLASGQEFSISDSTRFYSPGTYSVWFTWSQDKTNYYKPLNAGAVTVKVE